MQSTCTLVPSSVLRELLSFITGVDKSVNNGLKTNFCHKYIEEKYRNRCDDQVLAIVEKYSMYAGIRSSPLRNIKCDGQVLSIVEKYSMYDGIRSSPLRNIKCEGQVLSMVEKYSMLGSDPVH